MLDIDNIFSAKAVSINSLLIDPGVSYYVPAYQRPYSWDKENVNRLFEDLSHGLNSLLIRPKSINYLGSIIFLHDIEYKTILPAHKGEISTSVMTVIDGQQRLCTLLLINMALHLVFKELIPKLEVTEDVSWLQEKSLQISSQLGKTYLTDKEYLSNINRYYPKLIRSYDDVWSTKENYARYKSPIAQFIWDYIVYTKSDGSTQKEFVPSAIFSKSSSSKPHQSVATVFNHIYKNIKNSISNKKSSFKLPEIDKLLCSQTFFENFRISIPEKFKSEVLNKTTELDIPLQLLRLTTISNYINQRVIITNVTTKNEDDAFDMFEALNTTGTPLTAFETFKPKIIEMEGLDQYKHSATYNRVEFIEKYLDQSNKSSEKEKKTNELLISFALYYTGEILSKKVNDQRRHLKDKFDEIETRSQKQSFVKELYYVSKFVQEVWLNAENGKSIFFSNPDVNNATASICMAFLVKLKHSIVIAPLAVFYREIFEASEELIDIKRSNFCEAVIATAAFSTLWRSCHDTTARIDSKYRQLFTKGVDDVSPPFNIETQNKSSIEITVEKYKECLNSFLEKEKINDKNDWVKLAKNVPIYSVNVPLTQFVLFLGFNQTSQDQDCSWLPLKNSRQNPLESLSIHDLLNETNFTVEHIAPKENDGSWLPDIYSDKKLKHTLGNLLLLPLKENSIISNSPWHIKRAYYRLLGSDTSDQFVQFLNELNAKRDRPLSLKSQEVLENSKYLKQCKFIAEYTEDYSVELIETRSIRIAELIFSSLKKWL